MSVDIERILLGSGRITPAQLQQAQATAAKAGRAIDEVIVGLGMLSEDALADVLGRHYEIPGLSLARLPRPSPRVLKLVPEDRARQLGCVPLEKAGETLILLMQDPTNLMAIDLVRTASKCEIQPVVGSPSTVRIALDTFYMSAEQRMLDAVVPFVGKLLTEDAARAYRAIPVDRNGNVLTVACAGDLEKAKKAIALATGLQVNAVAARWEDIERTIARIHKKAAEAPAAAPAAPAAAAPAPAPKPAAPAAAPTPAAPPAKTPAAAAPVGSLDDFLGPSAPGPGATPPPPPAGAARPGLAASSGSSGTLDLGALLGAPATSSPATPKPGNGNGAHGPKPSAAAPPFDGLDVDTVRASASAGERPAALPPKDTLSLDDLLGDTKAPAADDTSDDAPMPNLGASGGPEGPRTGLSVEASTRDQMKELVAKTWGELDPKLGKLIPEKVARNYRVVITGRLDKKIFLAMENPKDRFAIDTVEFVTRLKTEVTQATTAQIDAGLEILYVEDDDPMDGLLDDLDGFDLDDVEMRAEMEALGDLDAATAADAAPIVRLVSMVIDNALKTKASDIHFEIYETEMRIRYRVDGVLREVMRPPIDLRDPVISRIKIMGKMDISERRMPQDGRLRLRKTIPGTKKKKDIDFRISSIPTIHGEKVVMRILDRDNVRVDLTELGFEREPLTWFRDAIHRPYGMCLVVGPSGSGKTNTLYSALSDVNKPDVNVITCEDPVEFGTMGLNQVQARESIGLSFATALRAFLRQDPNIIFVGEIRDFETAEIAVKAALTGHLVLSTLHTNDAPGCINRLTNMGIEPFLIASCLHIVVAQRLVRRVCTECRERDSISIEQLVQMGFAPEEARTIEPVKGKGCTACDGMGYKGRTGVFETLRVTNEIRELILVNGSASELKQVGLRNGMLTLRMSGLNKIREQITSCEEIIRETIG